MGGGDAEEDSGDGEEASEVLERRMKRFHKFKMGGGWNSRRLRMKGRFFLGLRKVVKGKGWIKVKFF